MRVISLGWGVQSFTLAAMAALGEIAPVDAAIHADTTHETSATYAFAAKWTPWLEQRGVRVVTAQNPTPHFFGVYRLGVKIWIPSFTDTPNAAGGQLRRQCTHRWKIVPIRRWLQANRNGQPVEQLLGISLDEALRMKPSDVKYITHSFPLVEMRMTRNGCRNWLERHGLETPGKSACVFCPYHNMQAWRDMKREDGPDWRKAVEIDEAIRKARPPYDLFLHSARIPLVDVDLSTPQDHGQMELWQETCESGYCWT